MISDKALGFVGLGELGAAIARRLAGERIRLVVWDPSPERRAAFAAARPWIEVAATPTDIGMECEIVISTLDAAGLRAAALGEPDRPGFAPFLQAGSLVIDMGVSTPAEARGLAGLLARGGIGLLDAPALGSAEDAATGQLEMPLAGWFEFCDRVEPLLSRLGRVMRCGISGQGHAAAALLTYARFGAETAAREALARGRACGLTDALMPDLIAAATSRIAADDPRLVIAARLAAELETRNNASCR